MTLGFSAPCGKSSQTQVQSNSSHKTLLPLASDKMLPLRKRVLVVETGNYEGEKPGCTLQIKRSNSEGGLGGCHWTSIWARSPCGRKIFNTHPSHCCDSLISNYQCHALRWMNEHICVDRRQVISSSHIEDVWSLWFQFLPRLRNQVFEGMANLLYLQCRAALIKGVPQHLLARLLPLPCSPAHTEGFAFSRAQLLVKPCSPLTLKWFSSCDDSLSISQRGNYVCQWNKEKSRFKEKVSINSYSQRRDFTRGDRHLILFGLALHRSLFLSAQSAWLSLRIEF